MLSMTAVLALHIPSVQKEIILRAADEIQRATNYRVQIESFTCWPFSRLYLDDVSVQAEGKQILNCAKIGISYSLSLHSPYVLLDAVYLEKPFLQLERGGDSKWQIPQPRVSEGQGGQVASDPFWVHVVPPKVTIDSGTIEGKQQGNVILSVKNISGSIHLQAVSGEGGPRIRVNLENLRAQIDTSPFGTWKIEGSGALDERELSVGRLLLSGPDKAHIELSGNWDGVDFEKGKANLVISDLPVSFIPLLPSGLEKVGLVSGSIAATRDGAKWSIEHDIRTDSGSIKGVLGVEQIGPAKFGAALSWRFTDMRPDGWAFIPEAHLNGRLDLAAAIEKGRILSARFSAALEPSSLGKETLEKGDLSGSFEQNLLTISNCAVKSSLADLRISATADLGGMWDSKHVGAIKAETVLEKANLEKINSRLQQRVGGTISVDARYDAGKFDQIRLWQAKVDANLNIPDAVSLKATANYQNEQFKATYDLDCTEVQKISAFFPQWQGKGRVFSRGTFTGRWPDLFWEGEINSQRLQYATLQAEQIAIKGKGKLNSWDDRHEISVRAQNVVFDGNRAASLGVELDQQKSGASFQLKGEGMLNQLSARLSGKLERIWDFPLVSVSTQGQVGWKDQTGTVDCKFDIEKDAIRINSASLLQGKQKAVVSSSVISATRADLRASLESVNAGNIVSALGFKDAFAGTVSGQVTISGSPERPEAKLSLQGSNCMIQGNQQVESLHLQGSYTHGSLSFQGEVKAPALPGPLTVTAKLPVYLSLKPPQFEVRQSEEFSSDIQIPGLKADALLPYLDILSKAGGRLKGDIHCGGTLKQPVVNGSGTWKDGLFLAKRWRHVADNIQAEWQADARNLYVRKAEVSHLGGSVSVTGYIDWPRFETFFFQGDAKDLQVPDMYGIDGKVSGHVEVMDSPQSAVLTGTLVFAKAKMSLGRLETEIAQNIQIVESDVKGDLLELKEEARSLDRFENRLKMNVALQLPQAGTWVTGKGLKAEITGGLKLEKVPTGPVRLSGELQVVRGTYSFQGKELKIAEGSLVFTGAPDPDPQMRVLCQKQVKDVMLQALVQGPLSHPKLSMSSVPAMDQVDILSYFMFEHPAGDLSSNEKSQLQDRAASWLGSETSNMIRSVFGSSPLAPDAVGYRNSTGKTPSFAYNPSTATSNTKETGIVEVGKYITPDLYVTYGKGVTGDQSSEVQIEYRLNRHISIQTQVGGVEQSGVDIFWRHDFGK
jgi:autotransporter translocation and assembly factor TamB